MYHNYTPRFLWAGVSKHDEDGSLNSTPKRMRSSEPGQILKKKQKTKNKNKIVHFVILSGFFFHIQYVSLTKKDNVYVHLLRSGSLSCSRSV